MLDNNHGSIYEPGLLAKGQLLPGQHPAPVEEFFPQDVADPAGEIHDHHPPLPLDRHAEKHARVHNQSILER